MTLEQVVEPLFTHMCRLNRSARMGSTQDAMQVRNEFRALLGSMRTNASSDPQLLDQYTKVELPLLFFVDFMVKDNENGLARQWKELAFERNELAGDEKFFDLLDETLKATDAGAESRLAVFYTCLGLGFTGWYAGQPEYLRKKMLELSARLRGHTQGSDPSQVCPQAYKNVDKRDLVELPGSKLIGMGIVLVGMIIVVIAANAYLYVSSTRDLRNALNGIAHISGGKK